MHKFKLRFKLLVVLTLISQGLMAQEIPEKKLLPMVNLAQIIEQMLEITPLAQSAKNNLQMARENIKQTRSSFYPQLSGKLASEQTENFGDGSGFAMDYSISARQSLFDLEKIETHKAAKIRLDKAIDTLVGSNLIMAARASASYITVLRQRLILGIAYENYNSLKTLLDELPALGSTALDKDTILTKGELGSAKNNKHKWIIEKKTSEITFKRETGVDPELYFLIELKPYNIPENVDEAIETAMNKNPFLLSGAHEIDNQLHLQKSTFASQLPRLEFQASGSINNRNSFDWGDRDIQGVRLGVGVTIPLSNGGKTNSLRRNAHLKVENAEFALQDQKMEVLEQLQSLYIAIEERDTQLSGLCESLTNQLAAETQMRNDLFKDITLVDYFSEKRDLYDTAINLYYELAAAVMDSINVHIQMGDFLEVVQNVHSNDEALAVQKSLVALDPFEALAERCRIMGY
ncbi:MAG: TolC family protein [Halobacteriovoraceae bacterium]|nr:TolC family protein [Halobacteriovoraceae bacterium]